MENTDIKEVIIIGSGPAGLTAAIYASRANLNPILFAGVTWGGQLMNTSEVENFPGFPEGISGPDLMQNMHDQAKRFGTEIKYQSVDYVDLSGDVKIVNVGEEEFKAKSVILATGSKPRKLGIPGEDEFWGKGVSTCATCDGAFYREKVVTVVGGGDSAMEEATFLTRFASKVYLIHRRDDFRASPIMADRAKANEKIEILYNTEVRAVEGENTVQKIKIYNNKEDKESELETDGFFLAIGHIPVTGFLGDKLPLDDNGYVTPLTGSQVKTNIHGVFIAGEIQDYIYKQAITTAASGCMAALEAQKFVEGLEE